MNPEHTLAFAALFREAHPEITDPEALLAAETLERLIRPAPVSASL